VRDLKIKINLINTTYQETMYPAGPPFFIFIPPQKGSLEGVRAAGLYFYRNLYYFL